MEEIKVVYPKGSEPVRTHMRQIIHYFFDSFNHFKDTEKPFYTLVSYGADGDTDLDQKQFTEKRVEALEELKRLSIIKNYSFTSHAATYWEKYVGSKEKYPDVRYAECYVNEEPLKRYTERDKRRITIYKEGLIYYLTRDL